MVRKDLNDFHTRRSERTPFRCAVSFRNPDGHVCYGWSRDISIAGVYVHTDDRERIGTLCEMGLTIRRGDEIHRMALHGQVARCDADGLAFKFIALPAPVRALVEQLLSDHLRGEFQPDPDESDESADPAADETATPVDEAPVGAPTDARDPEAS